MAKLLIDVVCSECAHEILDQWVTDAQYEPCPVCGGTQGRLWKARASAPVIGDEIDVTVRHGLCREDGTPQRFTSRAEMAREAQRRGLVNHVEHIPSRGSDKNPNTQRWV